MFDPKLSAQLGAPPDASDIVANIDLIVAKEWVLSFQDRLWVFGLYHGIGFPTKEHPNFMIQHYAEAEGWKFETYPTWAEFMGKLVELRLADVI